MQAPILTVQIGMGENILILAFVVIIIGGIGSIRGAFVAAIIVGLIDTIGRAFLPDLVRIFLSYSAGSSLGAGAVVDDDLHADGGRCWCSGRKACSRRRANDGALTPRNSLVAALLRSLALLPVYCSRHRQLFPDVAVHPHPHPRRWRR